MLKTSVKEMTFLLLVRRLVVRGAGAVVDGLVDVLLVELFKEFLLMVGDLLRDVDDDRDVLVALAGGVGRVDAAASGGTSFRAGCRRACCT